MADITKCPGGGCYKRETCYRFTAPVGERQSWGDFDISLRPPGDECAYYLPAELARSRHERGMR